MTKRLGKLVLRFGSCGIAFYLQEYVWLKLISVEACCGGRKVYCEVKMLMDEGRRVENSECELGYYSAKKNMFDTLALLLEEVNQWFGIVYCITHNRVLYTVMSMQFTITDEVHTNTHPSTIGITPKSDEDKTYYITYLIAY